MATMIPQAWISERSRPTGSSCDSVGEYDNVYLQPVTAENAWACVDEELYFLVGAGEQYVSETAC
jgi:hypothetical protein